MLPSPSNDPYTWPGSNVLRNKPGLRDEAALREFEYEQSKWRMEELREHPISGQFDLEHLKQIHHYLFQDVYPWAGALRTVSISKDGNMFALPAFMESQAKHLGAALGKERYLKGLEKPLFIERLAHYYSEWNALHPFREGNGRALRELFVRLAHEAGYVLDQTKIETEKDQWNAASRHAFHGDLDLLEQIFCKAITMPLQAPAITETNPPPDQNRRPQKSARLDPC